MRNLVRHGRAVLEAAVSQEVQRRSRAIPAQIKRERREAAKRRTVTIAVARAMKGARQ